METKALLKTLLFGLFISLSGAHPHTEAAISTAAEKFIDQNNQYFFAQNDGQDSEKISLATCLEGKTLSQKAKDNPAVHSRRGADVIHQVSHALGRAHVFDAKRVSPFSAFGQNDLLIKLMDTIS